MNREKQIEEMRKDVASIHRFFLEDDDYETLDDYLADMLFKQGYRKIYDDHQRQCTCYALGCQMAESLKREVAEEIFAEIQEMLNMQAKIVCKTRETASDTDKPMLSFIAMLDGRIYSLRVVEEHIAELKKKYTKTEGGE